MSANDPSTPSPKRRCVPAVDSVLLNPIDRISDLNTRNFFQMAYDGAIKHNLLDFFKSVHPSNCGSQDLYFHLYPEQLTWIRTALSGVGFLRASRMIKLYVKDPDAMILKYNTNVGISQIKCEETSFLLELAYDCAVKYNLIDFFRNANPPDAGYASWRRPELNLLYEWLAEHYGGGVFGFPSGKFSVVCYMLQSYLRDPEGTIMVYNNSPVFKIKFLETRFALKIALDGVAELGLIDWYTPERLEAGPYFESAADEPQVYTMFEKWFKKKGLGYSSFSPIYKMLYAYMMHPDSAIAHYNLYPYLELIPYRR